MKKQLFILAGVLSSIFSFAQIVNIPDANFKAYLVGNPAINTNGDNEIQVSEANAFTGEINISNKGISLLWGIEYFTEITGLDCSLNSIQQLDLSNNKKLITLNCSGNNLTNLDITQNSNLKYLDCSDNKLVNINIFYNSKLLHLDCGSNEITSLNLIFSPQLEYVNCSYNKLTSTNLSQNINLKHFGCHGNQLTQLDVTSNIKLEGLYCTNNNLTELDVSKNILLKLDGLYCYGNKLTKLDVSHNPNLIQVWALPNYELKELNLKNGNNVRVNFSIMPNTLHALAPKLFCVEVDDINWYYQNAPYLLDYIGQGAVYSTNCNLTLTTNDIQKSQIKIYPNPVKNILNIHTETKLQKVEIYSTIGQLVKTSFLRETNVANLPKGNYVVKITTDKGVQTEKFIKE